MRSEARKPIFIDHLLDAPERFREMIEANGPYSPVQRYFSGNAEYRASSGQGGINIIAPNFRGDWAFDRPLVQGAELLLEHPTLIRAASDLFETELVRPQMVFTNITWQLPFNQGGGHTDVPAFRGIDRSGHPVWFLSAMGSSGLFEEERINIATAVAWFYEGSDGGFEYWPDGPDAPSKVHEGEIFNTAVMGDNDRMYHRVRPVGKPSDGLIQGMTLDTRLEHRGGSRWAIAEGDETRAELDYDALRISVSWKAQVFRSAAEREKVDTHGDDLTLDDALDRFYRDLEARGIDFDRPEDPLRDEPFIDLLSATYRREPSTAAAA